MKLANILPALLAASTVLSPVLASARASDELKPAPADFTEMPACIALREQHPDLVGKTLSVGLGGYNKGFQQPVDGNPEDLEGLDPDMFDRLGACLGFDYTFQLGAFNVLVTSIMSGRLDIGPSLYVTPARQEQVAFVSSYQVVDGSVVPKGNPKNLQSLDDLCGMTISAAAGTFEATTLAPEQTAKCIEAGNPAVDVLLVQNTDSAILAVQSGRADIHLTSKAVAAGLAAADPNLEEAFDVDLPIRNGYPIAKENEALQAAILDGIKVIQDSGVQKLIMDKWGQGADAQRPVEIFN
ncbi:transporter substrate-binding domain-containing protein [Falsirhodobacter halotolerans]|uniref:transporter substrate-binding domain-containing protein n=1 Tax=Falsirhodobacter halotolerans TaxID=1146892 RepID=UPI001FD23BA2|nr:transporter substrate-binding domain-containing protein [Falsirhodobacter halotolerans]MCJ8139098.1 transporter substrate-binding domain-containing protein [Falsirhodobacter halotolerans]